MNKNLKRIIAREGLILLAIFVLGIIISCLPAIYLGIDNFIRQNIFKSRIHYLEAPEFINSAGRIGVVMSIFGYPIYLSIRFIVWAIKTLKEH